VTDRTIPAKPAWEQHFCDLLPFFGHRNWIVVADSAYPAQSKPGIETILAPADHIGAVRRVAQAITASAHVRANIYMDSELAFVEEYDAAGVAEYRQQLKDVFAGVTIESLPHEQIIARLDQSAQLFRILIVKTEMTIPYTTVFFELGCAYWNAEAEQRLRQAIRVAELNEE